MIEYLNALKEAGLLVDCDKTCYAEITRVTYNSKDVIPGSLFVCKGVHFKKEYLEDAIYRGAVCYVSEVDYKLDDNTCSIIVNDIRKAMQVVAETFYGPVSDQLHMTGITGTKGKSSTTYFVAAILDDYMAATGGKRTAVCSGIDNYDGGELVESHLTTPELMELYEHMDNAVNNGILYMTMEVSSQALKVGRVANILFDVGCFLNISPDHISSIEHPDFDDYFESKLKLFKQTDTACINLDCDGQERIREASKASSKVLTFSQRDENADFYAYNVESRDGRVHFDVHIKKTDSNEHIELAAFGRLNVENALASIAICSAYNVPFEYIKSGLSRAVVPGRMELFKSADDNCYCLVDYAHNKLSMEKLLETIKLEFPDRKMVLVFGSAGGKAFNRREELGTLAGTYCDKVYITEEDHGEEDLMHVCKDIEQYVIAAGGISEIVPDRVEAIKKAIAEADNTIVLITGKGRETRQKRGTAYIDTPSDADVVEEFI